MYGGIFAGLFYSERTSYYQKWGYLANLYNEVLKAKPPYFFRYDDNDIHSYRQSMCVALAIDIVQMEMWSHPSFKDVVLNQFFNTIQDSDIYKSDFWSINKFSPCEQATLIHKFVLTKKWLNKTKSEAKKNILLIKLMGNLTKFQLICLLEEHQKKVILQEKFSSFKSHYPAKAI